MDKKLLSITGDTVGNTYAIPVLSFKGNDQDAPKVYMQAALHADELPGTAVLHFLTKLLRQAEKENRIAGDITIIAQANPIGTSQHPNRQLQGRFDSLSGVNFNRDFPLISVQERQTLLNDHQSRTATENLKNNLLYLALGADIVVDLHCDYEAMLYTYICQEFWPDAKDFAAILGLHCVFLADGQSTAFEEAVAFAFRQDSNSASRRRFVTTLELRGQSAVSEKLAKTDAANLFEFLIARKAITGPAATIPDWTGKARTLDHIEIVYSPVAGTILFHRSLDEEVKTGDLLATIITEPGQEDGEYKILAPKDGTIVTRTFNRFAIRHDQLFKLICDTPTATKRPPGTLES